MSDERRKESRAPFEVRVEYRTVGSFLSDWTANLSKGGMFIQTENPLNIGTQIRLVFSLPGIPLLFDLNGEVKWSKHTPSEDNPPWMGVEFVELDERIRKRIEAYLEKNAEEIPDSLRKPKPRIEVNRSSGSSAERNEVTQPNARPLPDNGND